MPEKLDPIGNRARQAAKIAKNPDNYKVCVCCESIVTSKVVICPNCHGYRFNGDIASVIAQAHYLGAREQNSVLASDLE